jgi:hypothetical protein
MSWATKYIEELQFGNTVQFRPRGNSMEGKISSGQLVTVEPIVKETVSTKTVDNKYITTIVTEETILEKNDIVLCKVRGSQYLHLISAIRDGDDQDDCEYQISNNRGQVNGWITVNSIFGKCVKIEN